jgi:hypothetical protein
MLRLVRANTHLNAQQLAAEKQLFLWKFFGIKPGQTGWNDIATKDATRSAAQRARLYTPGLTHEQRLQGVRQPWGTEVHRIAAIYVTDPARCSNVAQFDRDVMTLKVYMNRHFSQFFQSKPIRNYLPGFRIAHAQKSLSLMLKHYWCHDMIPTTPRCPLDRRVLERALAPSYEASWTWIDSMHDYRRKMNLLFAAAGRSTVTTDLPQWELYEFNR